MTDDDLDHDHTSEDAFLAYVAEATPGNELAAELATATRRLRHDVLLRRLDEQQTTRPVVVEQDMRLVVVTGEPNNVSDPTQAVAASMRLNTMLASGNEVSIRGWGDR